MVLPYEKIMKTVKANFDWDKPSIKENKGHTQSEWGKEQETKFPIIIYSYDVAFKPVKNQS